MIIFDSSYLVVLLHPNPAPAMDRENKPVTQFRERVAYLPATMDVSNNTIGVPTPAMAEVLVRSGANRSQYVSTLSDTWKFQILPFDSRAAIEAGDLIAAIKTQKTKWDTWAKVKFDIQIVSIAKAEAATVIYSDDKDIENYAKRFKIRVVRICDLPLPPAEEPNIVQEDLPLGAQQSLNLKQEDSRSIPTEVKQDAKAASAISENNQLQADPPHPVAIQGSDGGRAQGEAAAKGGKEAPKEVSAKPCECGCGGFPKDPNSRFLPGHDLRKAYNDQKSVDGTPK